MIQVWFKLPPKIVFDNLTKIRSFFVVWTPFFTDVDVVKFFFQCYILKAIFCTISDFIQNPVDCCYATMTENILCTTTFWWLHQDSTPDFSTSPWSLVLKSLKFKHRIVHGWKSLRLKRIRLKSSRLKSSRLKSSRLKSSRLKSSLFKSSKLKSSWSKRSWFKNSTVEKSRIKKSGVEESCGEKSGIEKFKVEKIMVQNFSGQNVMV